MQKGDTLWKIANKYNVDFEHLLSMNTHLGDPNMIMPGMKVKVPTGKKPKKEMPIKEAPIKEKSIKESPTEIPLPLPMPELPQHLGTEHWQGMEPMPEKELPMEQPMMPPMPPSMPQIPPRMPIPMPMPMPQMPYNPCGCQPMPNPCQPITWPPHHHWAPMPAPAPMQPQEMGEWMEEKPETMPPYPMHAQPMPNDAMHHHHQPYPHTPQHGMGYPTQMSGAPMAQPYYPMQGNHEWMQMQQPYPQAPLFSNYEGEPHHYREHEQDLDEED